MRMNCSRLSIGVSLSLISMAVLTACGGGGGSSASGSDQSNATSASVSSGAITAFGSVFVNGHRFKTDRAHVIDDDTGATATLEVGQVVDVKASKNTDGSAVADELHLHPLVRGYVDAVDSNAGTITVMGQTIQINSSSQFGDRRACVTASTCTAISGQSGLTSTTSGGVTPGSYVTVHGYLFSGSSGSTNVIATLVSVADAPSSPGAAAFKVEGPITVSGGTATIGGLTLDLGSTVCTVSGQTQPCATAYASGQVVSVLSAVAPTLPATSFSPAKARLAGHDTVSKAGAATELEGGVSAVNSSAKTFVLRGISVDASSLSTTLPAVGDLVRVQGTLSSDGNSISATSVTVIHAAASTTLGLQGDVSAVTSTGTNTYTVSVLGQTVAIDANTRLADRSTATWGDHQPNDGGNNFNITTFQTYLAQSGTSQHVLINAQADGSGNIKALSLTIVPASASSGVAGVVASSPAPQNGSGGTSTTFTVQGIAVTAVPAAVQTRSGATATISAGDFVQVMGAASGSSITVASTFNRSNGVVDLGVPGSLEHHDRGGF